MSPEDQLRQLKKGAAEIVSEAELLASLKRRGSLCASRRDLIRVGPTARRAHSVDQQNAPVPAACHHVNVFDWRYFTARIGDPTGKNEARPPLNRRRDQSQRGDLPLKQVFKNPRSR